MIYLLTFTFGFKELHVLHSIVRNFRKLIALVVLFYSIRLSFCKTRKVRKLQNLHTNYQMAKNKLRKISNDNGLIVSFLNFSLVSILLVINVIPPLLVLLSALQSHILFSFHRSSSCFVQIVFWLGPLKTFQSSSTCQDSFDLKQTQKCKQKLITLYSGYAVSIMYSAKQQKCRTWILNANTSCLINISIQYYS